MCRKLKVGSASKKGMDVAMVSEKWMDHYTSNGWMVGNTRMKEWKAAVRLGGQRLLQEHLSNVLGERIEEFKEPLAPRHNQPNPSLTRGV